MKRLFLTLCLAFTLLGSAIVSAKSGDDYGLHNRRFYIQSSKEVGRSSKGFWDIPGRTKYRKSGANIQSWHLDKGTDRYFRFIHVSGNRYKIRMAYGRMYVSVRYPMRNGTNVKIGNYGTTFTVKYVGRNRWRILYGNYVICLDGRSSRNGKNIHMWQNHPGSWTEWVFFNPTTKRSYQPPRRNIYRPERPGRRTINLSLNAALRNKYQTQSYFNRVSYSQLIQDLRTSDMINILNRMQTTKQWTAIQRIVNGVYNNRDSMVKSRVYRYLSRVNVKKSNSIVNRFLAKGIKKNIQRTMRRERSSAFKNYLRKLANKF